MSKTTATGNYRLPIFKDYVIMSHQKAKAFLNFLMRHNYLNYIGLETTSFVTCLFPSEYSSTRIYMPS